MNYSTLQNSKGTYARGSTSKLSKYQKRNLQEKNKYGNQLCMWKQHFGVFHFLIDDNLTQDTKKKKDPNQKVKSYDTKKKKGSKSKG